MADANRRAARNTTWLLRTDDITPAPDTRTVLDALGLIGEPRPCSRHLRPHPDIADDPTPDQAKALAAPMLVHGENGTGRAPARFAAPTPQPPPPPRHYCPPGLRALIQGAPPVAEPTPPKAKTPPKPKPAKVKPAKPVKAAKPKTPATPKPPRAKPPRPKAPPKPPAACGTEAGYRRHLRENTPICDPCCAARRKADNTRSRRRNQRRRDTGLVAPQKTATCPSPSAYKKHIREKTPICDGCRAARNAQKRALAQKKAAQKRAAQAARAAEQAA